jgi:hypothetical protein
MGLQPHEWIIVISGSAAGLVVANKFTWEHMVIKKGSLVPPQFPILLCDLSLLLMLPPSWCCWPWDYYQNRTHAATMLLTLLTELKKPCFFIKCSDLGMLLQHSRMNQHDPKMRNYCSSLLLPTRFLKRACSLVIVYLVAHLFHLIFKIPVILISFLPHATWNCFVKVNSGLYFW